MTERVVTDLRLRLLGAWLAIVLLAGGGYATLRLFDDDRGAASPEAAGEQLVAALNDADVLGVIDLLPDGERQLLLDLTDDLTGEGERLDLLGDRFRLDGFPGVELRIDDPELDVHRLGDGLALVELVDGEASIEVDGDHLAGSLGDVIDEVTEAYDVELDIDDADGSVDIAEVADEAEDIADELGIESFNPFMVVVVEDDGRWFPSLAFTLAESFRIDAAYDGEVADPPDLGDGVEPDGGSDPVDAVQDLVDAATEADLEAVLELVDPGELGALQTYADVFFGALPDGDDLGIEVEITDADVESLGGGARRVVPTGLEAVVDIGADLVTLTLDDGCATLTIESIADDVDDAEPADTEICGDDLDDDLSDVPEELGEGFEDVEVPDELVELIEAFEPLRFGIVTTERDGEHYVSPIRTVLDLAVGLFRGLEPDDLEEGGVVYEVLTGGLDDVLGSFLDELDESLEVEFDDIDEDFPGDDDLGDDGSDVPLRIPTGVSGPDGSLLAGDVVEGDLTADETVTFTVVATAGEGYVGAQAVAGADLTITVLDAATGDELDFNDDFVGTDPEAFVRTAEGQVLTVEVAGYGESDTGPFVVYYETE